MQKQVNIDQASERLRSSDCEIQNSEDSQEKIPEQSIEPQNKPEETESLLNRLNRKINSGYGTERRVSCTLCENQYSVQSIHAHYAKMHNVKNPRFSKTNYKSSKAFLQPATSYATKRTTEITNSALDDEIGGIIRNDFVISLFANYEGYKYDAPHNNSYVRSNMRLLGTLLVELRKTSAGKI